MLSQAQRADLTSERACATERNSTQALGVLADLQPSSGHPVRSRLQSTIVLRFGKDVVEGMCMPSWASQAPLP